MCWEFCCIIRLKCGKGDWELRGFYVFGFCFVIVKVCGGGSFWVLENDNW